MKNQLKENIKDPIKVLLIFIWIMSFIMPAHQGYDTNKYSCFEMILKTSRVVSANTIWLLTVYYIFTKIIPLFFDKIKKFINLIKYKYQIWELKKFNKEYPDLYKSIEDTLGKIDEVHKQ